MCCVHLSFISKWAASRKFARYKQSSHAKREGLHLNSASKGTGDFLASAAGIPNFCRPKEVWMQERLPLRSTPAPKHLHRLCTACLTASCWPLTDKVTLTLTVTQMHSTRAAEHTHPLANFLEVVGRIKEAWDVFPLPAPELIHSWSWSLTFSLWNREVISGLMSVTGSLKRQMQCRPWSTLCQNLSMGHKQLKSFLILWIWHYSAQ